MTVFACTASADVGSTAITRCILAAASVLVALVQGGQPQLQQRLPPVRIVRRRLLVPLDGFVRVASGGFDFAQGEEELFAGALLRCLIQRACGRSEVALLHVGLPDADSRFVAVGVGLEQIVVGRNRAVVVLLVAVGRADLKVDHAERRRLGQDRLVGRDRLIPLLRVEQLIGGTQFGLQVLGADAAERARRRQRRSPQRDRGRRGRGRAHLQPGHFGHEARRLRHNRPLAGLQADHGKAAAVVARGGEVAR